MADALPLKSEIDFSYGVSRELAPGVRRLVANNPSHFTYKGTNTYLIGTDELALIDPGPDDEEHQRAILRAAAGRPITHILVTHTHHDHVEGLPRLQAETGAMTCGYGRTTPDDGKTKSSPAGGEYVDRDFVPDIAMRHGDLLSGPGWTFEALFTPGHAPDHLCFSLQGSDIMFSGDHVMSWSTSVVSPPEGNMAHYMDSLHGLLDRSEGTFLPGHGGQINDPRKIVRAFLTHRRWREQAILNCIREGHHTIAEIVPIIYKGLDQRLVRAAGMSVLAHLVHMLDKGMITSEGPAAVDSVFSAAAS